MYLVEGDGNMNKQLKLSTIIFFIIMAIILRVIAMSEIKKEELPEPDKVAEVEYIVVDEDDYYMEEEVESEVIEKDDSRVEDERVYWLSRIIHAEARGENQEGQIAVGNVVLNRVDSDEFPDTIKGVIFQKGQFSPVSNGSIYNEPSSDSIRSATIALEGHEVVDGSALFFYNDRLVASDNWIRTRDVVAVIGNHTFCE